MKRLFATLFVCLAARSALAQSPANPSPRVSSIGSQSVTNGTVIQPDGRTIPDAIVLIRGTRIVAVGPSSVIRVPRNASRIDVGRGWITPAFIDAHVHVTRLLQRSDESLRRWTAAGVLTVADHGTGSRTRTTASRRSPSP